MADIYQGNNGPTTPTPDPSQAPWWDKNNVPVPPNVPPPSGNGPTPPPIPGKTGSGKPVSVNTPSLDLFATNIGSILPVVNSAITALGPVSAQPGAFFQADQIRLKVQGQDTQGGIKAAYGKVLNDLLNGLTSLQQEVQTMSTKYKNVDLLNKATTTDLANSFNQSTTYFGSTVTNGWNGK